MSDVATGTIPINPGPIVGAGDRDLDQINPNAPNMQDTVQGWFTPMSFVRIVTTIVDGLAVPKEIPVQTSGIMQPKKQKLKFGAEGDRSWRWHKLHALPDLVLETNDVIVYRGKRYRVMEVMPAEDYGFRSFELVEDYSNAT